MANKRYYWLKLQEDFFKSKRIKKLRKIAGGDTYTIIYFKMQLLSISSGGVLEYSGLEPSFAEEIALDIDEEPDDVLITINYLMSCGLMETTDNKEFLMPYAAQNIGTESESASRVRAFRERDKAKALQCNATVTQMKRDGNGEKEIDKDKDIDIRTKHPTVDEVRAFIQEKGYHFDAESFVAFYESKGWKVGNQPMKSWKACCITWEKRRQEDKPKNKFHNFDERGGDLDADIMERFNAM